MENLGHKIFDSVKAKRLFVSLYENTPEEVKATFGQNIRDMFDKKMTDMESIEGFYVNEADVRVCHEAAMKTAKMQKPEKKTTVFSATVSNGLLEVSNTEDKDRKIPENW